MSLTTLAYSRSRYQGAPLQACALLRVRSAVGPFGRGLSRTAAALSRLSMELPLLAHDALQQHAPSSRRMNRGSQAVWVRMQHE
ncbi:MAG: hypothetical protein COB20_03130 [SAR86 cluster bacterium]|uniref:Uncharacterized protein n=1 Tax=SAR86 cluster bacterium TaxID=2030880 RepID=A0A2A4XE12_9GAMM|nr:MAG: hypothetical protein COB20_03130 [SAR86 cluster bacterium]